MKGGRAVLRRPYRLKVAFQRRCPICGEDRRITRWKSVLVGNAYRAECRRCEETRVYDERGKLVNFSRSRHLKLSFNRPRCPRCRVEKVIGGKQFKHKVLGHLITFICPARCSWTESKEYWTSEGRQVAPTELKAASVRGRWKRSFSFDRSKILCGTCRRPMQSAGRVRRVNRDRQPHLFFCDHGHPRTTFLCDDRGRPATLDRGIKSFPWGKRPLCPDCQSPLLSLGERQTTEGQRLFLLRCSTRDCPTGRLYFDERAVCVRSPGRLSFRRVVRSAPSSGARRICASCHRNPVAIAADGRSRYCVECVDLGHKAAWRRAQRRRYGSEGARLRARLSNPSGIRACRVEANLTQRELAQRAGVSVELLKKIEQGRVPLTPKSREKVTAALAAVYSGTART